VSGKPTNKQCGMALVLVLWLVVLLSVIATGHSRNAHIETRLAARQVDTSASRHVAEGIIQLAILDLLLPDREEQIDTSGRAWPVQALGRNATISIRRASGYIDLNQADDTVLHALFVAGGASDAQAQQLAHAVMDWRDADDLLHMHGAEDDDYRSAGLPWTSVQGANSTLVSVEAVVNISGSREEQYRLLEWREPARTAPEIDAEPPA